MGWFTIKGKSHSPKGNHIGVRSRSKPHGYGYTVSKDHKGGTYRVREYSKANDWKHVRGKKR